MSNIDTDRTSFCVVRTSGHFFGPRNRFEGGWCGSASVRAYDQLCVLDNGQSMTRDGREGGGGEGTCAVESLG